MSFRFVTHLCLHVSACNNSRNFYHILDETNARDSSSAPRRPPQVYDRAVTDATRYHAS